MKLPAFLRVDVAKYRIAVGSSLRVPVLLALAPFVALSLADADRLCETATAAPLSGRCPVILKTDLTHLANAGVPRAAILAGLPLVRFTTETRLSEIMAVHEAEGCPSYSPHTYTIEEGGMRAPLPDQVAFKRAVDPKGLLNPGKMISWEDPDFDFAAGVAYAYPGLKGAPA